MFCFCVKDVKAKKKEDVSEDLTLDEGLQLGLFHTEAVSCRILLTSPPPEVFPSPSQGPEETCVVLSS